MQSLAHMSISKGPRSIGSSHCTSQGESAPMKPAPVPAPDAQSSQQLLIWSLQVQQLVTSSKGGGRAGTQQAVRITELQTIPALLQASTFFCRKHNCPSPPPHHPHVNMAALLVTLPCLSLEACGYKLQDNMVTQTKMISCKWYLLSGPWMQRCQGYLHLSLPSILMAEKNHISDQQNGRQCTQPCLLLLLSPILMATLHS